MKELNVVLTELGISKVRLAKYLGVSRQMLYNYLAIDDLNNWPKEKAAKLLSLLNIECIKDSHPYEYDKFKQVFNNTNIFPPKKSTKVEITALAIPVDVDTPDWVSEFIDYKSIINDSLKNFPVESVGIERFDRATINYSNILKI